MGLNLPAKHLFRTQVFFYALSVLSIAKFIDSLLNGVHDQAWPGF